MLTQLHEDEHDQAYTHICIRKHLSIIFESYLPLHCVKRLPFGYKMAASSCV
uniref:Uncharacterized protein n=1 Tax=Arion vulgaris TaxID=1028688 RepID=A0A0B6Y3P8_9EUPU